jgi:hypothetical protein
MSFKQARRAQRRDANEKEIVKALRAAGAYVHVGGPFDILVGYKGTWWIVEIKDGAKRPSQRKLTKDEMVFITEVKNRAPIHLIESVEQALEMIGVTDKWINT